MRGFTMDKKFIEFSQKGVVSVRHEELDIASLKPDEVVIRNEASVISSGTELARLHGVEPTDTFPARPGYGSIGRIIAKGSNIRDFGIGDRVFYAGKHASVQRFSHCEDHQWAYLFPVPEKLDPVEAAVGCMAQIAMTAPNQTELRLGDRVAVFGAGILGVLAAIIYKLRGAEVIVLDPVKERCELAHRMGIDTVIDVPAEQQADAIMQLTGGKGVEVAVDAAGHSAVICSCIKAAALFGQIVLLGSPRASYTIDVGPVFLELFRKEQVLRSAHMWQYPVKARRGCNMSVEWAFEKSFDLIKSGKIDAKALISHVIKPEQAPEAYDGLLNDRKNYTCVVIDWRNECENYIKEEA